MEILKQGFSVTYSLNDMEVIRPSGVTEMNGNKYNASVKIRCSIHAEIEDEILGTKDQETTLEFKIVCDSDIEAGNVNRLLRDLKKNGVVISLVGSIPKASNQFNPFPSVEVFEHGKDVLSKYQNQVKKAS